MFRSCAPRLMMRATLALRSVPEGFSFTDNKVVDKDVHAAYENLETLRFTLTRQDEFIFKEQKVKCVTISGVNGDYGIYPGHAYKMAKLVPAPIVVENVDGTIQKFFASGGFAQINNEGSCDINTVECIPLEDLDLALAEKSLATAQAEVTSAKDEKEKAIADIRVGVFESIITALKH
jgi:F0F1-type ATP synthase epsilon subunit